MAGIEGAVMYLQLRSYLAQLFKKKILDLFTRGFLDYDPNFLEKRYRFQPENFSLVLILKPRVYKLAMNVHMLPIVRAFLTLYCT